MSVIGQTDTFQLQQSKDTKNIFWQTTLNNKRPKLKLQLDGIELKSLVDTEADITITSQNVWNPDWPLQRVSTQLLEIETLYQVTQGLKWIIYRGPEGQIEKLKQYVADRAKNIWERDPLQK